MHLHRVDFHVPVFAGFLHTGEIARDSEIIRERAECFLHFKQVFSQGSAKRGRIFDSLEKEHG